MPIVSLRVRVSLVKNRAAAAALAPAQRDSNEGNEDGSLGGSNLVGYVPNLI